MANQGLVLTGFMGMGKTTVGPAAAERLEIDYFDTDNWLETVCGINVPKLVEADMAKFRKLEAEALSAILSDEVAVISTGGGIVSTEMGRMALVTANLPVVWLRAPFGVAADRVRKDLSNKRPLFQDEAKAKVLFDERQQWYEETADFVVDASRPPEEVTEAVLEAVS